MVRLKIILFFLVLFTQINCGVHTSRYPNEYFSNYTEVRKQKSIGKQICINGAYISTFESNSNTFKTYTFLYQNNLITSITIPITINGRKIETEQELVNSISDGHLDDHLNFGYFKIEANSLICYNLDKWIGGLTYIGYTYPILESTAKIINDSTILTSGTVYQTKKITGIRFKSKLNSISSEKETLKFKPLTIKPDSSKSDFFNKYDDYLKIRKHN